MKKITFLIIAILVAEFGLAQTNSLGDNKSKSAKQINDSIYRSYNFLPLADVDKIFDKPAMLKDSSFKISPSLLRYNLTYIAVYKDSTSKGRLFFSFEQYKEQDVAKNIYTSVKTENEKSSTINAISDVGTEAFLVKDNLNYPFIIIRKENKLFKFKLYYLSDDKSLNELLKEAKKVVTNH